jgi:hypothetical protein
MDEDFGRKMCRLTANVLEKVPKDITESKLDCTHVSYANLIEDPINTIKTIYQHYNWEMTKEYENNLIQFIQNDINKRNNIKSKGNNEKLHSYTPEQYGLTTDELCKGKYEKYISEYNIPFDNK